MEIEVGDVVTVQLLVSEIRETLDGVCLVLVPINSSKYTMESIKVKPEMVKEVVDAGTKS